MSGALLTQQQTKVLVEVNKRAGLEGAVEVTDIGRGSPHEEWVNIGTNISVLIDRGYVKAVADVVRPSVCITEKGRQYLRMTSDVDSHDVDVLLAIKTIMSDRQAVHYGHAGKQEINVLVEHREDMLGQRLEVLIANDYIAWKDSLGYILTQRGVEFIQWYDEQTQTSAWAKLGPGPHVILSQAERTPTISGPMVDYLELALLRWKFGTPDQQERKANDLAQEMTREVIRQWEQP